MKRGDKVQVSGAYAFMGTVLGVSDDTLIIDRGLAHAVTLRRDPASTTPLQWRCQGMPVEVRTDEPEPHDFRERLQELIDKTRMILYVRTFDGHNWFINDADGNVVRPGAFKSEEAARQWCANYRPKAEVIVKRYDGV